MSELAPSFLPEEASRLRAEDARARERARSCFDVPLLLEAGAGTGKTAVLVTRVATWCLGPGWERAQAQLEGASRERIAARVLQRVVAITFTEAAAAEMATRVADSLSRVRESGAAPGFGAASRAETVDAETSTALRARARALLATLDQLTVCTIHAWCRRLLAAHPLEAGIHPRFEVDADETRQSAVVREVMEATLRDALSGAPPAAWLALTGYGVGPPKLEEALGRLVQLGVTPEGFEQDPFSPPRLAAFHSALRAALGGVREAGSDALVHLKGSKRSVSVAESLIESAELLDAVPPGDRAAFEQFLTMLREIWSDPRDVDRLRTWAKGVLTNKERAAFGAHADALAERAGRAHGQLKHARGLEPELLALGLDVLRPLLRTATDLLRARGIETYAGLLRDARNLLAQHPGVAARLRRGIDQLLVDEFQDTDALQCDLLRALALEGEAGERPILFLVGDPKQSIYGWRSADLRAYQRFGLDLLACGGEQHRLSVSFRSVPAVLEEVQRVVAPVMHPREGLQPAFEPLLASEERQGQPGFCAGGRAPVEHWVSWKWDAEAQVAQPKPLARAVAELEAQALAADLAALHLDHGVAWGEVGLLFRNSGDFDIYLEALRGAGIPYVVARDKSFYRRREIVDASALVRTILDPSDQLALVTWLRSASVGVPDAALLPLFRAQLPERVAALHGADDPTLAPLRTDIESIAGDLPLDVPGLERVAGWERSLVAALEALAAARTSFESDAPDVFVERVRAGFALEAIESARYLGAYRAANLDRFFRRLAVSLEQSGGAVSTLLRDLRAAVSTAREDEEGRPKDAAEDAVQVLTIHSAKGLAFGHVYLLQHHKEHGRGHRGEGTRVEERGGALELRLFDERAATPGFRGVALEAEQVGKAEQVRTLYVAMTRARERLVLVGRWSGKRGDLEAAQSHAALLEHREPACPDLEAAMRRLGEEGETRLHQAGALWVFLGLGPTPVDRALPARSPGRVGNEIESQFEALCVRREQARQTEQRPFAQRASRLGHEEEGHEEDAGEAFVAGAGAPRARALAVGTAVHRALEVLEPGPDPAHDLGVCLREVEVALASLSDVSERRAALRDARDVLEAFCSGPLHARLRSAAAHRVARELPVLLPPSASDAAVGFLVGAIDLVHRDPESGEHVVVDYKTDHVAGEAAHAERARLYAAQGAVYQRAVQEALELSRPPRFELWFLRSGQVEIC